MFILVYSDKNKSFINTYEQSDVLFLNLTVVTFLSDSILCDM